MSTGGVHSVNPSETKGFTEHVNEVLGNDADLKNLKQVPMNPDSDDIFKNVAESLVLPKLIETIRPGTIDKKKLAIKPNLSTFEKTANHNIAIDGCKKIGVQVVNIGASDLQSGTPHLCSGLLWQLIRLGLMDNVSPSKHPEMIALLNPNEDPRAFVDLPPEATLLRWFNYHLKKAGHPKQITNFSNDIKDSELYLVLLNQLLPGSVNFQAAMSDAQLDRRAGYVLSIAEQLNCRKFLTPGDIVAGNPKLNTAFVANLFNKHPGLIVDEEATNKAKKDLETAYQVKLEEEKKKQEQMFALQEEERHKRWQQEEEERKRKWEEEEKAMREKWAREEAERKKNLEEEERKRQLAAQAPPAQSQTPQYPAYPAYPQYPQYPPYPPFPQYGQYPPFPPQPQPVYQFVAPPPQVPPPQAPHRFAQIATFNPQDGRWHISGENQSYGMVPQRQFSIQCGTKHDIPVPGNYFGDGVRLAVFRPANGTWYIKGPGPNDWENTNGNTVIEFGSKDDIPVPGNYYGDGVTRLAIFKPNEGNWYIKGPGTGGWNQSQGNFIIQTGTKGDIPAPGDYTGIGRDHVAVYRPKEGAWYIKGTDMYSWNSSKGNITVKFGGKEDIPIPKQFEASGPLRLVLWRPSEHKFVVKGHGWTDFDKTAGNLVIEVGKKHDVPACADYFGEGRARFAVYRPSENSFLIKGPGFNDWGTSSGNVVVKFGKTDKDVPVSDFFGL